MHSTPFPAIGRRRFCRIASRRDSRFRNFLLTAAFLLVAPLAGQAQGINLSLKNARLDRVFRELEKQTRYRFVYAKEDLEAARPVSLRLVQATLEQALDRALLNQPVAYSITDQIVMIRQKAVPNPPPVTPASAATVRGKVVDEQGEAQIGASIIIKETGEGTMSDDMGNFSLHTAPRSATLVVSSLGHSKQEVALKGQSFIVITLHRQISSLDETVIIAYGTTTRRLNTGSISKVSSRDISRQPVSNPLAALQGRVPGLLVTQANGLPGSNFTVRLRGQNSIQSGNSPLFIIDGIPFLSDADQLTQRSSLNANSPFNTLNPSDIESIEVLKDADATAIYGSRGANGVILITTKKARSGKTAVEASFSAGWGRVSRTMNYLNTRQYIQMRREAFGNDGVEPDAGTAPDLLLWDTTRYTNWKKFLIGGTAHTTKAAARLSGGSNTTKFSLGLNYYTEGTVFPGKAQTTVRTAMLQVTHHSEDDRFTAVISTTFGNDQSNLVSEDLTVYIKMPPNQYKLLDAAGNLVWSEGGVSNGNPLAKLRNIYNGATSRLTSNATLSYKLMPGLVLRTSTGLNSVGFEEKALSPIAAQNPVYAPQGSAFFGHRLLRSWIVEPQAEYTASVWKKGLLTLLGGASWQENRSQSTGVTGYGYTDDARLNDLAAAGTLLATNSESQYRYQSIFARLTANWANTYLLNLTARTDASSRFSPERQWADFGAVGGAWIFTEAAGLKKRLPFLNYGKLRASYGITGNDQIGDYQYLDSYSGTLYPYGAAGLQPTRLYNPDYSWERNTKWEGAIEIGVLENRIVATVGWYRNRSSNQIINYSLPSQTGFTTVLKNFPGIVENTGLEGSLTTEPVRRNGFVWTSSFNISRNRNRLIAFPGILSSSYATSYIIGQPLDVRLGFEYTGIDPQTGVYQFSDLDHDGTISYPSGSQLMDYRVLGTLTPTFFGGWQNTFAYKAWNVDVFFQFVRQKGLHPVFQFVNTPGSYLTNQPVAVLDRWQKPGDRPGYERYTQDFGNPAFYPAAFFMASSSGVLTEASYIRLKNASLSYTLPWSWLTSHGIEAAKLYIQSQNLLTITRYEGADPEVLNPSALPTLRMVTVGAQLNF